MNREETKQIIQAIVESYPNYRPQNLPATVNVWATMLSDYSLNAVASALKTYILTDTSGFAPSIGQIVQYLPKGNRDLPELEAWAMTRSAIQGSYENHEKNFAELPEICRRVVGKSENLREWGQMDSETVGSVVMSQFLRGYRTEIERMKAESVAPELRPERAIERVNQEKIETAEQREERKITVMSDEELNKIKSKLAENVTGGKNGEIY